MSLLVGWKPKSEDPRVASVRFRCLTPLNALRAQGFPIELYKADRPYSIVIFSKLYDPANRKLADKLRAAGVRTILDLSDNHFYNPDDVPLYQTAAADMKEMARVVDAVICCSAHLAGVVKREAGLKTIPIVVGDAVETFNFPVDARSPFDPPRGVPFRIVWFGSHGSPNAPAGLEDLLRIKKHLENAERERSTELVVISNNHEKFKAIAEKIRVPSRYVEWEDAAFAKELGRANLVVIPITPNPYTKCKSNNRLATALWYGVPAIADRIPAYDDLAPCAFVDDWENGMRHALACSREAQLRTAAGSAYVRAHFNTREIAEDWRRAIKSVAQAGNKTKGVHVVS